jgi:hypothetical protein
VALLLESGVWTLDSEESMIESRLLSTYPSTVTVHTSFIHYPFEQQVLPTTTNSSMFRWNFFLLHDWGKEHRDNHKIIDLNDGKYY